MLAAFPPPTAHVVNPRAAAPTVAYPTELHPILSRRAFAAAWNEIRQWPDYAETPLHRLHALAERGQVGAVWMKDESGRFGLGSFKALGGAYAVFRLVKRHIESQVPGAVVDAADLMAGRWLGYTQNITVATATDGNHGRSVAWGARLFGCNSVITLHRDVSAGREAAIAALGAQVMRVDGTYDEAVRETAINARMAGWQIISDTSWLGYMDIPCVVMQGYTVMVEEALRQLTAAAAAPPTHVFIQAGVGALPAAVCAHLWETLGPSRPRFIVVEPDQADGFYRSVQAGHPVPVPGALKTLMAGLACGDVSPLAWAVLNAGATDALTLPDRAAVAAMRVLARGNGGEGTGDSPRMVGEAGIAGLAGFLAVAADPACRVALALGPESRVLLFATEGATDPALYQALVSDTPAAIAP